MSTPIANFGFSRNNLQIAFKNLSFNVDNSTTYLWDFGDTVTSTDKEPSHTYTNEGFFNVTLVVIKESESSEISITIGVGSIPLLNTSILSLCHYYLPSTLLVNSNQLVTLIQSWQLFLQPLVEEPLVAAEDTHNELKWPALVNKMIAMIVAKEVILKEANAFLATMANEGGNSTTTENVQTSSTGQIKSIEAGPTKTEWYENNNKTVNSEAIKNIGASFHKAMAPDGILEKLQEAICNLASRNSIYLPECPKIKRISSFKVGNTPNVGSSLNTPSYITAPWELEISF